MLDFFPTKIVIYYRNVAKIRKGRWNVSKSITNTNSQEYKWLGPWNGQINFSVFFNLFFFSANEIVAAETANRSVQVGRWREEINGRKCVAPSKVVSRNEWERENKWRNLSNFPPKWEFLPNEVKMNKFTQFKNFVSLKDFSQILNVFPLQKKFTATSWRTEDAIVAGGYLAAGSSLWPFPSLSFTFFFVPRNCSWLVRFEPSRTGCVLPASYFFCLSSNEASQVWRAHFQFFDCQKKKNEFFFPKFFYSVSLDRCL